jgi:hypothetical protein
MEKELFTAKAQRARSWRNRKIMTGKDGFTAEGAEQKRSLNHKSFTSVLLSACVPNRNQGGSSEMQFQMPGNTGRLDLNVKVTESDASNNQGVDSGA